MLKELTVKERWKFSKEYTSPYLANMGVADPINYKSLLVELKLHR